MNGRDALGLAAVVILYGGTLAGAWLVDRRAKKRIRQEKTTGRLPARRTPGAPISLPPVQTATLLALWAFAPVILWLFTTTMVRLLTPPPARRYLEPLPTFSQALRGNLTLWLLWACFAFLAWVAARLGPRLIRRLSDPVLSRAEELRKAGDLDGAVREVREAISANGPSIARWNALAEILMIQERWSEALKVSLDIEDRRRLHSQNRHRKALALWKLGLPEVALSEFHRANTTAGRLADVCSHCQALIDLGLFDRAWDQLRRAEIMYGRGMISKAEAPHLREQIDACRARLAEHFADKKPNGFEEL